jgi:hypothetical protein
MKTSESSEGASQSTSKKKTRQARLLRFEESPSFDLVQPKFSLTTSTTLGMSSQHNLNFCIMNAFILISALNSDR